MENKRILLDTNIYGYIIMNENVVEIVELVKQREDILIYGSDIIRKELRATPKEIKIENRKLRIALLDLYDTLISNHYLLVTDKVIKIANDYYEVYYTLGGRLPKKSIINDLIIVSVASYRDISIVVSNDNKTMLSELNLKSYEIVNKLNNLNIPEFINYDKFKRWLV